MADTITILDGLAFEQDQTTSILYDIDHATNECVKSYAVHIPLSASQCRVIFNNAYDPDGSTVFVRVRLTKVTSITTPTKTENTQALEWQEIAQNTVLESGTIDVSASWGSTLHIDIALSSTTAHTGTEIVVQMASEAAVDDAWSEVTRFVGPTGTAIAIAFAATEPATETTIAVTDPATNNMDNDGKFKFIENAVAADCEIVYQTANSGD